MQLEGGGILYVYHSFQLYLLHHVFELLKAHLNFKEKIISLCCETVWACTFIVFQVFQ